MSYCTVVSDSRPRPVITMPIVIGSRDPMRPTMRPDATAVIITVIVIGSASRPASVGEYPCTRWKNSDRKKTIPKKAKLTIRPVRLAPAKVLLRKKLRSSMGVRDRVSTAKNPVSATAATAKQARMRGEVQP